MAADFPTSLADFLSYTAASEKGVPYDVFQNIMDEILAVQTLLGAGSAAGTAFTPTIISSGGGTPTYTLQLGRYRRLFGLVQVIGHVTLATFGTLAAGNISIGGLPVASVNTSGLQSPGAVTWWNALTTAAIAIPALVAPSSSQIDLFLVTAATTGPLANLTKANLSSTSDLIFSAIYPAT